MADCSNMPEKSKNEVVVSEYIPCKWDEIRKLEAQFDLFSGIQARRSCDACDLPRLLPSTTDTVSSSIQCGPQIALLILYYYNLIGCGILCFPSPIFTVHSY